MITVNSKALDFTLKNHLNQDITLSSFINKKIILYFYSKDNTSGCTNQALMYKKYYEDFKKLNCIIIGISKDNYLTHAKFKEKYELPFILLSDEKLMVLNQYDVYKEKNMYGKKVMGTVRSSFIIDENFNVIKASYNVKANEDALNNLNFLNEQFNNN